MSLEEKTGILEQMYMAGCNETKSFIRRSFDKTCKAFKETNKDSEDPYTLGFHRAVDAMQGIIHILTK